jgi:hypothetical protein
MAVVARDEIAQLARAGVIQANGSDGVTLSSTCSLKLAALWTMAFI